MRIGLIAAVVAAVAAGGCRTSDDNVQFVSDRLQGTPTTIFGT